MKSGEQGVFNILRKEINIMALTKKFSGKIYYFDAQFHTEIEADNYAKKLRTEDFRARVTYFNQRWLVWRRD